jgi:hypothetical protein
MTWAQFQQWEGLMRDEIAKTASAKGVMGGDGVTVNGEIIALEPASASSRQTNVGLRWMAIFGEVTMTQTVYVPPYFYPTLESAVFEYEPRLIALIPMAQITTEDYYPGITGTAVLPYIITNLPTYALAGEIHPGRVIDDDLGPSTEGAAYHYKKEAVIKFYARGYSDDALVDGVLPFARGRRAGDVKLTLTQAQSVVTGDPLEVVPLTANYEVTTDYTGASLTFTSFPTEPLYGGSLATISLTGLQRPQ